jgi:hypothetical protein
MRMKSMPWLLLTIAALRLSCGAGQARNAVDQLQHGILHSGLVDRRGRANVFIRVVRKHDDREHDLRKLIGRGFDFASDALALPRRSAASKIGAALPPHPISFLRAAAQKESRSHEKEPALECAAAAITMSGRGSPPAE